MRYHAKCLAAVLLVVLAALFSTAKIAGIGKFIGTSKVEPAQKIIVIAALNRQQIAGDETDCFSFFSKRGSIFGSDHSSDKSLIPVAERALSPLRYREGCSHILSFNIIKDHVGAVRYGGDAAELLMSFDLCALKQGGGIDAEHCTSKNIYLLRNDLDANTAFGIGIKAFAQEQHEEWTVMTIQLH